MKPTPITTALLICVALLSASCKNKKSVKNSNSEFKNLPVARKPKSEKIELLRYIYNGPLPMLEDVNIVASMKGLTVRVSGNLPKDWIALNEKDGKTWKDALPFYALVDQETPVPRISVVYPMASTASQLKSLIDPRRIVGQDEGGVYEKIEVNPWRTDESEYYGGFPFIHYTMEAKHTGFAFHGPIDLHWDEAGEWWELQRGYVSHGCKRMQAEHVIEMAHLIGVNMKKVYQRVDNTSASWPTVNVRLKMLGMKDGYDLYFGKPLDVRYTVSLTSEDWVKKGMPQVVRAIEYAPTEAFVAPTWDARDFPYFACPVKGDPKKMIGEVVKDDYCRTNYFSDKLKEKDIKINPRPEEKKCVDFLTDEPRPCYAALSEE